MSLSHDYVDFGPPFDNSDADIILRSGVTSVLAPGSTGNRVVATDFLVHKLFLVKASSVFKSLLSSTSQAFGQQNAEDLKYGIKRDSRGTLPVLCLSEHRDTIHCLLTAIYPVDIVYPQTLEAIETFAAACKYGMPSVIALFQTYRSRVPPVATTENVFRAYLSALNQGLKEEALEAAQLTLSLPQKLEDYGPSLCNASGPALHALWKYRGMAVGAIKRGVDQCLEEVGDRRDWKLNLPGDEDCCLVPAPDLRGQLVLFTEKINQNCSTMNISHFVNNLSTKGVSKPECKLCKRQQRLDDARLFDCLERHVRGQIKQTHDEFLLLFDGLGDEVIHPQPSGGQPRYFGAPFDRGDSDITIRSCDSVHFQVHKAILGVASIAFDDMFTAPGLSPHGEWQVKQVIDLTEDSKTLLHLLSAIYPMDPIVPDTLEDAYSLLSACQKYQMDTTLTRISALIRTCTPPLFTAKNSFRAYGIASRYHLEEEALHAARLTLECSMDFDTLGEDLRFISGADLFRLCGYRNECTKVAKDSIGINRTTCRFPSFNEGCLYYDRYTPEKFVPRWWHSHFLARVAGRPSPKTVTDRRAFRDAVISHRAGSGSLDGCQSCLIPDFEYMTSNALCAAFEEKLREVIEQVRLDV